jgi:acetate kinase
MEGDRVTADRVLVVNTGSSGLKLSVTSADGSIDVVHTVDGWGDEDAIDRAFATMPECDAVGHRVVHGGPQLREPVWLDAAVEAEILALTPLAPAHQPHAIAGIHAARRHFPSLAQVVCFDSGFHTTMPDAAAVYPVPREWTRRWDLRRLGFHGFAHAYASRRARELLDRAGDPTVRIVTCQLGAGASLCATRGGRSVDTTMGWTPLEGLVMATRSGTVDPGLVLWLLDQGGLELGEVMTALETESGLAGLSGVFGGDMRAVLDARRGGDPDAAFAIDVYVHRLRRELGAMLAVLGGVDAVVFSGGVGEHAPEVRAAACAPFAFAGLELDDGHNLDPPAGGEIGRAGAPVRAFVLNAREDLEIARAVRALLAAA